MITFILFACLNINRHNMTCVSQTFTDEKQCKYAGDLFLKTFTTGRGNDKAYCLITRSK